ncbi:serine--tRNA ligase [Williamsoniiplasma luminosum]|uniref:Serine--tRNA ligase n=1 Tax=Williamsoniiplasma luminosum TaxID=214888 RepID=A0A2S0NKM5_9MOLU|nr:serine--tRNA ligase [Williamsoniiplasma luminosum]AVP49570.1 MAG: serine--tRNA ligase [Williamsoniiplasma luminosum]
MLDVNFIEINQKEIEKKLSSRGADFSQDINFVVEKNKRRKEILLQLEQLKAKKNQFSKEIGLLMRDKKDQEVEKTKQSIAEFDDLIVELDEELKEVVKQMNYTLGMIPNLPDDSVPIGASEDDNPEVRKSKHTNLLNTQEPHWEIASKLQLVDFELGPKLSGSRFLVYTGLGSKLVRAIADILLTRHVNHGYKEFFLPVIVNAEMMYGTGNLPRFEEDAYKTGDQYLIPTAEVPLTNIHANEILDEKVLPLNYTSFTQCFRQEAGSAGRDTKGMIRLHQFNKVELVKIVKPEESMNELEKLVKDAEAILDMFDLPYRVIHLCTGDMGFSSLKTYDLEVWFPSQNKYREISSCSNCGDFQARNMMTRYKDENNKTQYVHTLNGSGLAIDRLIAAILENYWDGEKLKLPKVLLPYFNNQEFIK